MSQPTQNRPFWKRSSRPIVWLSTEKLKQTQQMQTCIHNQIYYNTKWTKKIYSEVWSPPSTSSLEMERAYSGSSR